MNILFKRGLPIIMSVMMVSAGVSLPSAFVSAADVETVHNLVLFAQFDDTSSYNFMDGRVEEIQQMCEDKSTYRSLAGYIDEISYGQMQIECHFPQLEDGVITPYKMSQSEDSYLNVDLVAMEVLENVAVPENTELDGNNDGMVDNVILVVDASSEGSSGMYWPCAFGVNGVLINGKRSGMVNLHNSISLFDNYISGGAGVLCHEFLHSVGYPDLYRSEAQAGIPVGQWDIMASNSIFLQYPLAYMRASISGWLETETITENGSYTLQPVSAGSGNRVYLLKTPLSDTEFFAVEYRQQGAQYSEEMDVKIYGSGMVVYRVNTEMHGNHNDPKDQIYVFRPGETGLDAGEGDIFSSNYGGEGAPDEIGSLDFSSDITDGALVYSDGTNSGIKLSDITINDDNTLSFNAEFAPTADVELWQTAADTSEITGASIIDMAVSGSGDTYILCGTASQTALYEIIGGELVKHSDIPGSCYNSKLVFSGNTPYVLYNDADFNYVLMGYNAGWQTLLKGESLSQYTDIAERDGKLYIGYTEGTYPYALYAMEYDTASGEAVRLGGMIAENACSVSVTAGESGFSAAYRDLSDNSKPKLAVWYGTQYEIISLSESVCDTTESVTDGENVYIAATGEAEGVYCWNGSEVTISALPEFSGSVFSAVPIIAGGRVLTAINTQSEDDLSVYELVGDTWEKIGNSLASEIVNASSLAFSKGTIYSGYITVNGTLIIKSFQLENESAPAGDVNADGEFSVADVVMFQKYIISASELKAPENGDVCQDEMLDVFDLIKMREMLIEIE